MNTGRNEPPPGPVVAPHADQERMFEHLREAFKRSGFLFGDRQESLMHAMRQLIGRALPTPAGGANAPRPRAATAVGGEASPSGDWRERPAGTIQPMRALPRLIECELRLIQRSNTSSRAEMVDLARVFADSGANMIGTLYLT